MNNAFFLELDNKWYLYKIQNKVYLVEHTGKVYFYINASNFNDAFKILEPYGFCR